MVAGADSFEDLAVLRHGAMDWLPSEVSAPTTLGTHLRVYAFGHVRQLDAVAARLLAALAGRAPVLAGVGQVAWIDVDDAIKAMHGCQQQAAAYGYSKVKGLNARLAVLSTPVAAPVLAGVRSRKGNVASAHGAIRLLADAVATARRCGAGELVTVRADAAVAEVPVFTAFMSRPKAEQATPRLIVHRVKCLNPGASAGQGELFDTFRYHAVFTDSPETMLDAEAHRQVHVIVEQVIADLKNGPLAHLPSGVFTANAAWTTLATMAFNLTRAAASIAGNGLAKATTATIRWRLIRIAASVATTARRLHMHIPATWAWAWAWAAAFANLFEATCGPPQVSPT